MQAAIRALMVANRILAYEGVLLRAPKSSGQGSDLANGPGFSCGYAQAWIAAQLPFLQDYELAAGEPWVQELQYEDQHKPAVQR